MCAVRYTTDYARTASLCEVMCAIAPNTSFFKVMYAIAPNTSLFKVMCTIAPNASLFNVKMCDSAKTLHCVK